MGITAGVVASGAADSHGPEPSEVAVELASDLFDSFPGTGIDFSEFADDVRPAISDEARQIRVRELGDKLAGLVEGVVLVTLVLLAIFPPSWISSDAPWWVRLLSEYLGLMIPALSLFAAGRFNTRDTTALQRTRRGWVGLGWVGLGWVGLGWVGLRFGVLLVVVVAAIPVVGPWFAAGAAAAVLVGAYAAAWRFGFVLWTTHVHRARPDSRLV